MISEVEHVTCLYCVNQTAEVTDTGLKCVYPYCKREWTFEEETLQRRRVLRTLQRAPITSAPVEVEVEEEPATVNAGTPAFEEPPTRRSFGKESKVEENNDVT